MRIVRLQEPIRNPHCLPWLISPSIKLPSVQVIQDYIAPQLVERDTTIRIFLAGTGLPRFQHQNIVSFGHVNNLDALLDSCDVAIVPIESGTGIRTKTLDYMSHGLPVVSTEKGVEGIDVENSKHAIVLHTVGEEFVDAVVDLAHNPTKCAFLSSNALELIESEYSYAASESQIDSVLECMANVNST